MIGAFATGKTSLVARYVRGIYSEKYQTTIGVKIDKKVVQTAQQTVNLILWDIYGEDEFQRLKLSYLRGASGFILVIDGTRLETLSVALDLHQKVRETLGPVPFVAILNKLDLREDWEVAPDHIADMKAQGWDLLFGSAKTGLGVEDCFGRLTQKMLMETP
ncbi:GTP-binding protein [Lyngbya confervoides BDU141951]|uniref:GTP-binding protein n=2 Tax=Lyngbya TaxID=28073 RepID=A0ABD4T767_9CYAN|nr:GTP-binding protein [Lyngbya confervoides BDU141951]